MGRISRAVTVAVLAAAIGALGFWAGRTTLRPIEVAADAPASAVVVPVKEQTVGRTLSLNVSVTQPRQALAVNSLPGVVTRVSSAGSFANGAVLYRVGADSVRVVAGAFPFFRDLAVEDTGQDVRQLRDVLVDLGYLKESGTRFDWATQVAVKSWQKELDSPQTGAVRLGELMVVKQAPASISFDTEVLRVGALLAGGEKLVFASSGTPTFELIVAEEQARLIPQSATIIVSYQDHEWGAVIRDVTRTPEGQVVHQLTAPKGGAVCGKACDSLAFANAQLSLLSSVQVVPPVTGPAVPAAGVLVDAAGQATVRVVKADGSREVREVTVIGSQDGVAVVKGVTVGEQVQALAAASDAAAPTAAASR